MHVIPLVFTADQVPKLDSYFCPTCRIQSTSDPADPGWVRCPMVNDEFICLGCCIDHQKPARAENFAEHPLADLFEELSNRTGRSITSLRKICLLHQESLLNDEEDVLAISIEKALAQISE